MQQIEAEIAVLETAKLRWMAGGEGACAGNALVADQNPAEAQLRLLAQAGQVAQICFVPERPTGLTDPVLLPDFELPLLAEGLRPVFRRLMTGGQWKEIIALMAARGVMAHPFDWLPPKGGDDVPIAYAALQAWVGGHEGGTITAENWDAFLPAMRREAMVALRRADPAAALGLLSTYAAGTGAEERCRLVAVLSEGLSAADQPYLESLSNDRSSKVRDVSKQLLARLGVGKDSADAQELADFMEVKKALLTRRVSVGPKAKLNRVQETRMMSLFAMVGVGDLARSLDVTVGAIAKGWIFRAKDIDFGLFRAFCETGTDADLRMIWDRIKAEGEVGFLHLRMISDRLSRADLAADCAAMLLAGKLEQISGLFELFGPDVPDVLARALLEAKHVRMVLSNAKREDSEPHLIRQAESLISDLALLLPRQYAKLFLDQILTGLFHPADPALDVLNFNISLEGPTQ